MISVTLLSAYMYCPRKIYLTKVLGLIEPPNAAMVKGSIRHNAFENLFKDEDELVKEFKQARASLLERVGIH